MKRSDIERLSNYMKNDSEMGEKLLSKYIERKKSREFEKRMSSKKYDESSESRSNRANSRDKKGLTSTAA